MDQRTISAKLKELRRQLKRTTQPRKRRVVAPSGARRVRKPLRSRRSQPRAKRPWKAPWRRKERRLLLRQPVRRKPEKRRKRQRLRKLKRRSRRRRNSIAPHRWTGQPRYCLRSDASQCGPLGGRARRRPLVDPSHPTRHCDTRNRPAGVRIGRACRIARLDEPQRGSRQDAASPTQIGG